MRKASVDWSQWKQFNHSRCIITRTFPTHFTVYILSVYNFLLFSQKVVCCCRSKYNEKRLSFVIVRAVALNWISFFQATILDRWLIVTKFINFIHFLLLSSSFFIYFLIKYQRSWLFRALTARKKSQKFLKICFNN